MRSFFFFLRPSFSLVDRRYFSGDRRLLRGLDPQDLSGNNSLAFEERERERSIRVDDRMHANPLAIVKCGDIVGVT